MQSKRRKCSHVMMPMVACFPHGSRGSLEFLRQMVYSRIACILPLYRILQISSLFCSGAVTVPTVRTLRNQWHGVLFPWASARGHIEALIAQLWPPHRGRFPWASARGHIEAHCRAVLAAVISHFRGLRPAATLKLCAYKVRRRVARDFRGLRPAATLKRPAAPVGPVGPSNFRGLRPAATLKRQGLQRQKSKNRISVGFGPRPH